MVLSGTDCVPGSWKESGECDEGEQLTALVEAEARDLFHTGCKDAGLNHYSAVGNQRQDLVRLMAFLRCHIYYLENTKFSFLYPNVLIFPALKKYLLLITWI